MANTSANGQQELTLAQRLKNVVDLIEDDDDSFQNFPITDQHYCVICKFPRLDPDPTGITCGRPKCLASLGERVLSLDELTGQIDSLEEKIVEIAELMGINPCKPHQGGQTEKGAEQILQEMKTQIEEMSDAIEPYEPLNQ